MVPLDELEEYSRRPRWRRYLVPGVIVLAAAPALFFLLQPADDTPEIKRLPDFELPLLDGGGTLSSSDLRGRPAVLNFFASWCVPCREEAPLLEKTYKEYKQEGVQFVGVNLEDTEEAARDFVDEFGITYPVIKDYDKVLAEDLGATIGWPQTFFVTSDLRVSSQESGERVGEGPAGTVSLGAIEPEELRTQIESLLEEE